LTTNRALEISQRLFYRRIWMKDPVQGREVEDEPRLFPWTSDAHISTGDASSL
jgi:hypothetical protein